MPVGKAFGSGRGAGGRCRGLRLGAGGGLGSLALFTFGAFGGLAVFLGLEGARVVGALVRRIAPERQGTLQLTAETAGGKRGERQQENKDCTHGPHNLMRRQLGQARVQQGARKAKWPPGR